MAKDIFTGKYYEAVGRRKTATARVRLFENDKEEFVVNGKELSDYFASDIQTNTVKEATSKAPIDQKFAISVIVQGGGLSAQSEAIRLGIARALVVYNEEAHTALKKEGFLKRDPRMKERKKFGLRKARRAPQWSKR